RSGSESGGQVAGGCLTLPCVVLATSLMAAPFRSAVGQVANLAMVPRIAVHTLPPRIRARSSGESARLRAWLPSHPRYTIARRYAWPCPAKPVWGLDVQRLLRPLHPFSPALADEGFLVASGVLPCLPMLSLGGLPKLPDSDNKCQ